MINIITEYKGNNVINDFESFFEENVLTKDINDDGLEAMKVIDDATIIDVENDTIQTKYGTTDILHLSTGCKTVLSYLYIQKNKDKYKDKVLNITGCGANALDKLFEFVDRVHDSETIFLLEHSNMLYMCENRDYNINGHQINNLAEGVARYGTDI